MRKQFLLILIFVFIIVSGCISNILPLGSINVLSDPLNSEVYLDSFYKGSTPCSINGLSLGEHNIELRHEGYPVWRKNITLSFGKTENITADLSENLVPNIYILCKSQQTTDESLRNTQILNGWAQFCIYSINEAVHVSGIAVRPYPKQNPNLILSLDNKISNLNYSVRINDDSTFEYVFPNLNLASGNHRITASLPSGQSNFVDISIESPEETKVRKLKKIVEDYHKTHTYSLPDLFVCADMAIDVWDIVETQGIHAIIKVGNVNRDINTIQEANHAWVMAEIKPNQYVALETTGGYLVCDTPSFCSVNNDRYLFGWKFDNPKDFKDNIDKRKHPCSDGYVLGDDNLCHQACGGAKYCTGNSVCLNGECRGCNTGYILGDDYRCYPECPPTGSGRYCKIGICRSDGKCHLT